MVPVVPPGDLIDEERFAELGRDFPAAVVAEVVATFRETTPPMVEHVLQAVRDGDVDLVVSAAHRLKGGCMVIGAQAVERIAGQLERDGFAGVGADGLLAIAHDLEHMWAATDAELARRVGGASG